MSDQKYLLGLTPSEVNNLLCTRLRRSTEQLVQIYNDISLDTPKKTAEALGVVLAQLHGLKFELELLDTWKKETLAKLNSKETQQ